MNLRILLTIVLALCSGCVHVIAPQPVQRTMVWSKELQWGVYDWRHEAEKRFGPNVVLFVCHGLDEPGPWRLCPDAPHPCMMVDDAADMLHSLFPNDPIVLITCNVPGDRLTTPGVYYSMTTVRGDPYDATSPDSWTHDINDFVGQP